MQVEAGSNNASKGLYETTDGTTDETTKERTRLTIPNETG
jgi:hypothetical protein